MLSIVIPARDEEGCIEATVRHLHLELELHHVPHEIIVVDDGSTDRTWQILTRLRDDVATLRPVQNTGAHGFGLAIRYGLAQMQGDAVTIMMADESDDVRDAVVYWKKAQRGLGLCLWEPFHQRGGHHRLSGREILLQPAGHLFIRFFFRIRLNDTTNAFKAYRKTVIDGVQPLNRATTSTSPWRSPSRPSCAASPGPRSPSPGATAAPASPNSRSGNGLPLFFINHVVLFVDPQQCSIKGRAHML